MYSSSFHPPPLRICNRTSACLPAKPKLFNIRRRLSSCRKVLPANKRKRPQPTMETPKTKQPSRRCVTSENVLHARSSTSRHKKTQNMREVQHPLIFFTLQVDQVDERGGSHATSVCVYPQYYIPVDGAGVKRPTAALQTILRMASLIVLRTAR